MIKTTWTIQWKGFLEKCPDERRDILLVKRSDLYPRIWVGVNLGTSIHLFLGNGDNIVIDPSHYDWAYPEEVLTNAEHL